MTQILEHLLERASQLPAVVQERLARRWLKDLENQQQAAGEEAAQEEQPFVSAYDLAKDVIGSLDGPEDLSTNPKYMKGFGESSMR